MKEQIKMRNLKKIQKLLLLTIILTSLTKGAEICKRYKCYTEEDEEVADDKYCMREQTSNKERYIIHVIEDRCDYSNKEYCSYNEVRDDDLDENHVYSVCKLNRTEEAEFPITISLPGEVCDSYSLFYDCPYGRKRCEYGRCVGYLEDEPCDSSMDCDVGLFCHDGYCKSFYILGDVCVSQDHCGRNMRCMFQQQTDPQGVCASYFSLPDGTSFYAKTEFDELLCSSKVAADVDTPTVSQTLPYFFEGLRTCGISVKSLNKGQECNDYSECSSDYDNIKAYCGCWFDMSGYNHCGNLNGDIEYDDYRTKFTTLLAATQHCHVSREFDNACGEDLLFQEFKCAQLKAKYYYLENEADDCLRFLTNDYLFPELAEVEYWCNFDDDD